MNTNVCVCVYEGEQDKGKGDVSGFQQTSDTRLVIKKKYLWVKCPKNK